jgi:glycerol-3-phosphate acyltransferase PlsY
MGALASVWPLCLGAVLAYLLGSIPFGLILTRFAGAGDIRRIGSGNIGATNVLRTGRKGLAALTLLLDAGKGAVAVLIANPFGPAMAATVAVAVVLGHLFPVWLGFNGGKGVATSGGVLLAYFWPAGLLACATWLAVAVTSRYSSLAAISAALLAPLYAWLISGSFGLSFAAIAAIGVLVLLRHRGNIARLVHGEESRISLRSRKGA